MAGKKRRRREERPTIHPRNKYSENPPDFDLLASLYPSFKPYVFYSRDGRPRIDWTDFNATRELTRVLLLHDHGLNWWIPDGQLCPTVPNRSNYIHWIEDLLSSAVILKTINDGDNVRGFDIGTGANCIYPLLGASLQGWSFVGSDVTDVALEWAEKNVASNPQISQLIDIRKVESCQNTIPVPKSSDVETSTDRSVFGSDVHVNEETVKPSSMSSSEDKSYQGPPILLGVVKDGEMFDFCMCNPPFFEKMDEAGLNPRTSCGGTPEEMVCPGGEKAFIIRIIEDSVALKQTFRWYTSMVGRKSNLKFLISKLRDVGVTIVKTTEFVQGQTSRWGLAWSFVRPSRKLIFPYAAEKKNLSFMLEGVQRQFSAADVLQSIDAFFAASGASCKLDASLFSIDITVYGDHCTEVLKNETHRVNQEMLDDSSLQDSNSICFRVLVFEQIRGTLLVKGSLQQRDSPIPGVFSAIFHQLEEDLRYKFCRHKATNNHI